MEKDSLKFRHVNHLISLSKGYMASRIFLTAIELGVFREIGNQQMTADQIAMRLHTDKRATEILLNALGGLNLLEKNNNVFLNIKEIVDLLTPESPHYIGGLFNHTINLWKAWSNLTQIVKTGRPNNRDWTDEMRIDLALAMKEQSNHMSDMVATLVDCFDANVLLDLGGGSGSCGMAFARCYPHLKVVIFDNDEQALSIATKDIVEQNLQDRVSLEKGDFILDDFGDNYDLILLSSIICLFGEEENSFLLKKIKKSLRKDGRVIIWDLILNESKSSPTSVAIFAVNMLINTPNGRSYSFYEVKELMQSSGFKNIYRIPIDPSQIIIGRKCE